VPYSMIDHAINIHPGVEVLLRTNVLKKSAEFLMAMAVSGVFNLVDTCLS